MGKEEEEPTFDIVVGKLKNGDSWTRKEAAVVGFQ